VRGAPRRPTRRFSTATTCSAWSRSLSGFSMISWVNANRNVPWRVMLVGRPAWTVHPRSRSSPWVAGCTGAAFHHGRHCRHGHCPAANRACNCPDGWPRPAHARPACRGDHRRASAAEVLQHPAEHHRRRNRSALRGNYPRVGVVLCILACLLYAAVPRYTRAGSACSDRRASHPSRKFQQCPFRSTASASSI